VSCKRSNFERCLPNAQSTGGQAASGTLRERVVVLLTLVACLATAGAIGCARYHVGTRSLFPPDVATVYVPVFESSSFRRFLAERLTEAVIKEIEKQTPYKVVGSPDADSVLTGRILRDSKRILVDNGLDEAREVQVNLVVQVSWVDRRGDMIRDPQALPVTPQLIQISQPASLVAEFGQSVTTAQQKSIDQLAKQVVAMMEVPW